MTTQQPGLSAENQITPEIWSELKFEGKEYCALADLGVLMLRATPHSPERKLADLTAENCIAVAAALVEKFKEVESRVQEVDTEWQQTEDKLKLAGKISRLKDYLRKVAAVGDFAPIFNSIEERAAEIQDKFNHNYAEKLALAEKAESLKDSKEWKVTSEAFRRIVESWKNAHPGEKTKSDQLWDRIENARNHFYERKRQHTEGVEQDMMQNLDIKMEICELAEQHAYSEEWRKSSAILKELMDRWKAAGKVVSVEKNEELWHRFISARNIFFERKRKNFESIQAEQEANYLQKLTLVENAEALADSTDWKDTTLLLSGILDQWKKLGKVPLDKADELWNRLQQARDKFFNAKRQSAGEFKTSLEQNYAQKLALLNRTEQIKDSNDWRGVTEEMNELMFQWKKIGQIPREYGDELWERFISARHHFFNRKDADREQRKTRFQHHMDSRFQQTQQFLDKLREELADDEEKLKDFQESLRNTTGVSGKEQELRKHLENLIDEIEKKIPARKAKIEVVAKQFEELLQKKNDPKTEQTS